MVCSNMDGVIIDLDDENSNDVVDISKDNDFRQMGRYDDILKENTLLFDFIERCFEVENSEGMQRVINRTLIPVFKATPQEFRDTDIFKRLITKAMCKLVKRPNYKFSCVKQLCEDMEIQSDRYKKKHLLDLTDHDPNDYMEKITIRKRRKFIDGKKFKHKKKELISEIIVSDDSDGFEVPIINLDDVNYIGDNNQEINKSKNSTKSIWDIGKPENINRNKSVEDILPPEVIEIVEETDKLTSNNNPVPCSEYVEIIQSDEEKGNEHSEVDSGLLVQRTEDKENGGSDNITTVCLSDDEIVVDSITNTSTSNVNEIDKLLVPHKEEEYSGYDEMTVLNRIKKIEEEIRSYKDHVDKLEQMEVNIDSMSSPYIQCERYKSKIVLLYKQLCKLTGEKPVKRREVRLKPAAERSQLPMRKLEEFLNATIGKDGLPLFPDFCDVVRCVEDANEIGPLRWSRQQIMTEARALFTHCGRALQKNRQRREWRHMLSLVKKELIEDPAEKDPELMARLQENKMRAKTREAEVLERFTEMEYPAQSSDEADGYRSTYSDEEFNRKSLRNTPSINEVRRIKPFSVPFSPETHRVSKIIHKKNQVVEIVVFNDTKSDNKVTTVVVDETTENTKTHEKSIIISNTYSLCTNNMIIEKEKPPSNSNDVSGLLSAVLCNIPLMQSVTRDDNTISCTENNNKRIQPPQKPNEIGELVESSTTLLESRSLQESVDKHQIDNTKDISHQSSVEIIENPQVSDEFQVPRKFCNHDFDSCDIKKELDSNLATQEDGCCLIQKEHEPEITNKDLVGKIEKSVILDADLATRKVYCNPVQKEREPESTDMESADIEKITNLDTDVATDNIDVFPSPKKQVIECTDEKLIVDVEPSVDKLNENTNLCNNAEITSNDKPTDTDLVTNNVDVIPLQKVQALECTDTDLIVDIEKSVDQHNESTSLCNNTEVTCNAKPINDTSDASINILSHFLKARVVVPRMTIKFVNDGSKDSKDSTNNVNTSKDTIVNDGPDVIIKQEPCINIQQELDELGDNFTTTIFDIEDPFLVIEISSEEYSSEEEDT